jgi:hypothetical protein
MHACLYRRRRRLAILQFAGYNAAITAIFVCSWMMNRSSG